MHNTLRQGVEMITTAHEEALRGAAIASFIEVDALVTRWAERLRNISTYQEGLVEHEQVRADCRLVFERLLGEIGAFTVSTGAASVSERVGHSRALRGVPLSDLLAAVRLDFTVLWEALLAQLSPADPDLLAECVPRIWEAVERHSQEVIQAYTLTQHSMTHTDRDESQLWFTRLLDTDGRNHVLNTRASEVLGLELAGDFIAVAYTRAPDGALDRVAEELTTWSVPSHVVAAQGGAVLIAQLAGTRAEQLRRWLDSGAPKLVMIGPLPGVHLVPAAVRLLHAVGPTLHVTAETSLSVEENWPLAIMSAPDDAALLLRERYLAPLRRMPQSTQLALESVAVVYLGTGSIAETARRGFFHRNTVTNRLEELAACTGLDIRIPGDAVTWSLAHAAEHGARDRDPAAVPLELSRRRGHLRTTSQP